MAFVSIKDEENLIKYLIKTMNALWILLLLYYVCGFNTEMLSLNNSSGSKVEMCKEKIRMMNKTCAYAHPKKQNQMVYTMREINVNNVAWQLAIFLVKWLCSLYVDTKMWGIDENRFWMCWIECSKCSIEKREKR